MYNWAMSLLDRLASWMHSLGLFARRDGKPSFSKTQLATLNGLLAELLPLHEMEPIANAVLAAAEELLHAEASSISLPAAEEHARAQTYVHNLSAAYLERAAAEHRGLPAERAVQTAQAVYVEEVLNDAVFQERIHFVAEHGWRALLALPLLAQEQPVGVLTLYYHHPHPCSESELAVGMHLAHTAGQAIQNARQRSQLENMAIEADQRAFECSVELQAAKEHTEAMVASLPDAVFVLDERYQLLQANPFGRTLLERAKTQGLSLLETDFLRRLSEDNERQPEKAMLEIQGRAYHGRVSPMKIASHRAGYVIVLRDVTQFKELERAKDQFVSDVSHELRTPLANLSLYLDLLNSIEDPAKRRNYMEVIQRETGRLAHLVEDILTISRMETGRLPIKIQPVTLHSLLNELTYDRTLMAAGQGITLLYEASPDLPIVQSDAMLLSQCLSNLLTNAIRYTPPGGVVRVSANATQESSERWVTLSVSDNGVGILPEEIDLIFQRFYRGSASRQTGAPGTGLGLSISKEIVEHLGGRLTVESAPNQGSVFTVWLPLPKS